MSAESKMDSCVNQLPLPGTSDLALAYYRSKLFVAPFMTNCLLTAAMPLLSLLERLSTSTTLSSIGQLRENIAHELQAFRSSIQRKDHADSFDAIAYYLLSATIDELLGKSYLRVYGISPEFQAFTPPSLDEIGPEQRFFDIVCYIKDRPHQYLDVIELAYYCLIAGFEGVEHNQPFGRQHLENLIEELYQIAQQYRANPSYQLFTTNHQKPIGIQNKNPWIFKMILACTVLVTSYGLAYSFLEKKAEKVHYGHTVIATLDY